MPLFDAIERSRNGPRIEEKTFDLSIFSKTNELAKKYDIRYRPDEPLCQDDALADRTFEAAVEFYLSIGTYCGDTGRAISFSQEELRSALDALTGHATAGLGPDKRDVWALGVEPAKDPFVLGGIQTALYSDVEMQLLIYRLCAQDRSIDGLWGGIVPRIDGKYEVIAGTPLEIYQYREDIKRMRQAVDMAGRPGMVVKNNAPSAIATIAMANPLEGMRPSDFFATTGASEMKIFYDDLNRAIFGVAYGSLLHCAHNATIGGFSGSLEGAAIVAAAGVLQSLMVNQAKMARAGVTSSRSKSRVTRQQLWASTLALQALARNTRMILDGSMGDHPAAGPGTKQYLYEAAAGFVSSTVSGGNSCGGTRKFVIGTRTNYGTPLESRWMGEVCKAAVGMSRPDAGRLVNHLLEKYETHVDNAPPGGVFEQLYDQATLQPIPEYLALYNEVKEELAGFGLRFREY